MMINPDNLLARGLAVLDMLASEGRSGQALGFSRIQERLGGINPASVSKVMKTLCAAGVAVKTADGRYALGSTVADWAEGVLEPYDLIEIARPFMQKLNARWTATSLLAVLRGAELEIIHKITHEHAPALMEVGRRYGNRFYGFGAALFQQPDDEDLDTWIRKQLVDAPSMVKRDTDAALAILDGVRQRDAYVDVSLYPGTVRVAVPLIIQSQRKGLVGCALVGGSPNTPERLLADLLAAAKSIAAECEQAF